MDSEVNNLIVLTDRCEKQMRLDVCNGCDKCGLRCSSGVPATRQEWERIQSYIADAPSELQNRIARVLEQNKSVDLGDEVTVTMCRYRDMERSECSIYPVRPLVCRLLGHVEWMPCPIEKVPARIETPDALALMKSYASFDRRTFEEWEAAMQEDSKTCQEA